MPSRDIDRFVLAVEQLQVARELLDSGSAPKARMAVILLDGLVDAFLYRRLEDLYRQSEGGMARALGGRTYPKPVRSKARADFGLRLTLCSETAYGPRFARDEDRLVRAPTGVVLAIGHDYRNAAYHRDRHNVTTIGVIGALLLAAAAELFVRSQARGVSSSVFPADAVRLEELGVGLDRDMINWPAAAEAVAARITQGKRVDLMKLVGVLTSELEERLTEADELAAHLHIGGPKAVAELMAAVEFQRVHGSDPELLKYGELRDPARRAVELGVEVTQELLEQADVADAAYIRRYQQLRQAWQPQITLNIVDEVRRILGELKAETDELALLQTYHAADLRLSLLEDHLAEAVAEFDRYIDMQIEAMSGR